MTMGQTRLSSKAWVFLIIGLLVFIITVMLVYKRHASLVEHTRVVIPCPQHMHVVYVRTLQIENSTMTRLLWRFGIENNLKFLLPKLKAEGKKTGLLEPNAFHLPTEGKFCDMMTNILLFNYENYRPYFPHDVAFITVLRDPLRQLYSTIYYYDFLKRLIPGDVNKLDIFLKEPTRYDVGFRQSLVRNPASEMLGLPTEDMTDFKTVSEFISNIDKRFAFVLIDELFDESLLILRKRLCWPMRNILYKWRYEKSEVKDIITKYREKRLRNWSTADYKLYDYFKNKLLKEIKKGGKVFQKELINLRLVLSKTEQYCKLVNSDTGRTQLVLPKTSFYNEFAITEKFCILRNKRGPDLSKSILSKHDKNHFCDGKK